VVVYVRGGTDVFDDWSQITANWRTLARALREAGFEGIMFDNESYFEPAFRYPGGSSGRTLQAYRDQTRQRGREIISAIQQVYPGIQLLAFHGPYLSEPRAPLYVAMQQAGENNEGVRETNLQGSFFVGLVEGSKVPGAVIDGGEVYQYRSKRDFTRSYQWRKTQFASAQVDSPLIPVPLRPKWSSKVGIAFAVYDRAWKHASSHEPGVMRTTLENALRTTDKYVWFYVEGPDWLVPGQVSQEWIQSVRGAVAAAR